MRQTPKISRMMTIHPHTYRGGGFLYYSRSIDEETPKNGQKIETYEDHEWLAQTTRANGQLNLFHPKMKGDNFISQFKGKYCEVL